MSNILLVLYFAVQFGQSNTGELRLTVTDGGGLPIATAVQLVSEANQVRQSLQTSDAGTLVAKRLPFGRYRVEISRTGFTTYTGLVEITSALPKEFHVTLAVAAVTTQVTVNPHETLLDPYQSSTRSHIGAEALERRVTAAPGRSLSDLVNTQPGWLLEANGILHPRGSEYAVQYVVDGLPITDNRSPSFAPALEAESAQSLTIMTAGYPAEYGRKLGGVVEVVTAGDGRTGWRGSLTASGGSLQTGDGYGMGQYGWRRSRVSFDGGVTHTDRYLDPPVEENFTNTGTSSNVALHFEHELTDADRLGVIVRYGQASFQVPNEQLQQDAGQEQRRSSDETAAQFSYQHIFAAGLLADVRGLARTLSADLSSNALSTPMLAEQQRGFDEYYVSATLAAHAGRHEWKVGMDAVAGTVRENFSYLITDPEPFDPDTPPAFTFADRRRDREHSVFVQDQIRLGALTVNAGLRWDHYHLVVNQSAVSPRIGAAWFLPSADLVIRGSYDRVFQTPAVENLLLASSPAFESIGGEVVRLPVQPSLGNFYEAGISKRLFGRARLDVTAFRRVMSNFADDDLFLNTGVSFPIAFERASIYGTEVKLDLRQRRALSGFVSYTLMRGTGELPVTGGLFLGDEAADLLASAEEFPISQDQRHSLRGRVTANLSPRMWIALAVTYGSGLPVECEDDCDHAAAQYGERIISRVDFDKGRVRPSLSFDVSASVTLRKSATRTVSLQADVLNVMNRLNVINFAGLFSGTALAPPRSVAVRLHADF